MEVYIQCFGRESAQLIASHIHDMTNVAAEAVFERGEWFVRIWFG